jgi:hypothetical protein
MRQPLLLLIPALCIGAACTDIGLGLGTLPLPAGGLPAPQTLEGGAQIRLSQAGFQKLTSVAPGLLNAAIDGTPCLPRGSVGGSFSNADYCWANPLGCTAGCPIPVDLDATQLLSVPSNQTVRVQLSIQAISASMPVRGEIAFIPYSCTLGLGVGDTSAFADVRLSIDPATGALGAEIDDLGVALGSFSAAGCPFEVVSLVRDPILDALTALVAERVALAIDGVVAALLPAAPELAGRTRLPALALVGTARDLGNGVETRLVPGGYVQLNGGGLSLGVVTGFNADAEPTTRSPGQASEPHACVSGLVAPDLAQPPASLAATSRGSFLLPASGAFLGLPEPVHDLSIGVSRTALDLAGHHVTASGDLCLAIDVGSRARLDDLVGVPVGTSWEDLRLVWKPQQPLRFEIGAGADAHLVARLDDLRLDVETAAEGDPLLEVTSDVALGLRLQSRHDAAYGPMLETTRTSLEVSNTAVAALDDRYAHLAPAELDALASALVDLAFAAVGAESGNLYLSPFAGFDLDDLAVARVDTASDAFLAFTASLGAFAGPPPSGDPAPTPQPLVTTVDVPTPAALRAALIAGDEDGLPAIRVALPTSDGPRPLEHAWRIEGGHWHAYEASGELVIRDRSFAWQGLRGIWLRSRVVGDDATTSELGFLEATIDWAPPALLPELATLDETFLTVPAIDAASPTLEWALGRVGESEPATPWSFDPAFDAEAAWALGDEIVAYARDPSGHVAQATLDLPEPDAAAAGLLALAVLRSRLARRRRQPRRA